MVLYADVLFLINLVADYLLLLASGRICAVFAPRWRLIAAALFGAAYAILAAVGPEVFSHILMWLVCAGLMLVIAYGSTRSFPRLCLVFTAVSAGFAGALLAAMLVFGENTVYGVISSPSVPVFLTVFILAYIVFSVVFRRTGRCDTKISRVEIRLGEKTVTLAALRDTGNSLSDPLTGRKVMVAGLNEVKRLFPAGTVSLAEKSGAVEFTEVMNALRLGCTFHLVPFKAVGTQSGLLAAFKPDEVIIDGKSDDTYLVALSPETVGDGGAYSALMGAA